LQSKHVRDKNKPVFGVRMHGERCPYPTAPKSGDLTVELKRFLARYMLWDNGLGRPARDN